MSGVRSFLVHHIWQNERPDTILQLALAIFFRNGIVLLLSPVYFAVNSLSIIDSMVFSVLSKIVCATGQAPQSGHQSLEALQRINQELGTTMTVITHNANIAQMVDRVIHLADGRISQMDENKTKLAPGKLS